VACGQKDRSAIEEVVMRGSIKTHGVGATLRAIALTSACLSLVAAAEPVPLHAAEQSAASLYERVGGYDFIAQFVDTAFPRVATHPQLRRLFQGHSVDSQIRQRQLIVDALCQATGGPCFYVGRPMRPLHEGLGITESDWAVFIGIMGGALDELQVPEHEQAEWLALFEQQFKPEIIEKG
jgi:hemoglobin